MYVWQQAEGQRHARQATSHSELPAGSHFRSLCRENLVVAERDVHGEGKPGWLDPICPGCDARIRSVLRIPARDWDKPLDLEALEPLQRPVVA